MNTELVKRIEDLITLSDKKMDKYMKGRNLFIPTKKVYLDAWKQAAQHRDEAVKLSKGLEGSFNFKGKYFSFNEKEVLINHF